MKKYLLKLSNVSAFCFVAMAIFNLSGCGLECMFEPAPLNADIISPNKIYEIQIKEDVAFENTFLTCYGDHKVTLNVTKNNQPFISDEAIYDGDGMDQRFGEINAFWLAENVLSFYGQAKPTENRNEIKVINQTDKTIKDLHITGGGKFVIFDLMPKGEVILLASTQNHAGKFNNLSWISCFGAFEDGEKIAEVGNDFRTDNKKFSDAHYSVIIKDLGADIESAEFEKAKYKPSPIQIPTKN